MSYKPGLLEGGQGWGSRRTLVGSALQKEHCYINLWMDGWYLYPGTELQGGNSLKFSEYILLIEDLTFQLVTQRIENT